jgi:5'-3' exonuclease
MGSGIPLPIRNKYKNNMKRIVVIDTSSILHAAKHSIGKKNKLSHGEQYTFIIYGFLIRLRIIAVKTRPTVLVFANDSGKEKSIRKLKYYPPYKMSRDDSEKTPEQLALDEISYPQFDIVKKIIKYVGWKNVFETPGYEADDIIASICKKYTEHEVCIVTSDEDMYQLLDDHIAIMKPKNHNWYTKEHFEMEYGVHPKMWKRIKVYGGCSTDGVPGIPIRSDDKDKKIRRIGPGFALKYIKGELKESSSAYKAIKDPINAKIIKRNKYLTILPLVGTPEYNIQMDNNLSLERFTEVCNKYGFNSILTDLEAFSDVLKLK